MCYKSMEGRSPSSDNMTQQPLSGFQDLQGPMQFHHNPHPHFYQHVSEVQPKSVLQVEYTQEQAVSFVDYNEAERRKSPMSDDYAMNCAVTGVDGHIEVDKERETPRQRTKWTEEMAKLLITAVSYIGQYASAETGSGRSESSLLLKMGKWNLVSEIMVERGYYVKPQQCEDKFNKLNKYYKKLNDLLGEGTSSLVVQNPKLLDEIYISEKVREDVKKILISKQLFYEEMCSYHSRNLPHDPYVEWSLQLALWKKNGNERHSKRSKANDEQDHDAMASDHEIEIATEDIGGMGVFPKVPVTMLKKVNDHRISEASNAMKSAGFNGILETSPNIGHTDSNPVCSEGDKSDQLQTQWMALRSCRLRLQEKQLKDQLLMLEKKQFKWQEKCWKHDMELKKMRLENERLKNENEHMAIELEYKDLSAHYNLQLNNLGCDRF